MMRFLDNLLYIAENVVVACVLILGVCVVIETLQEVSQTPVHSNFTRG